MMQTSENLSPIKVDLDNLENENNFKLVVLADLHLGEPNVDISLIKKTIEFVKENKDCYVILNGDILNTALKTSKSDIYTETMNVTQAQNLAVELFTPIKDRILAMTTGNHEERAWRETGIDLSLWLASRLGIEDRYRRHCVCLSVNFGKDLSGHKYKCNIFARHGSGGSGRLGSALNAVESMDGIVNNADLYIMSHVHKSTQGTMKTYSFNDQGSIECKMKCYYTSNSYLLYADSYGLDKGYKPSDIEPNYLNIRGVSSRNKTKLSTSFKIDKVMI